MLATFEHNDLAASMTRRFTNTISPREEMLAYETLWGQPHQSVKTLAELFKQERSLPSELFRRQNRLGALAQLREDVEKFLHGKSGFSVAIHGDFQYPKKLREAKYPLELFYYRGEIGLLESRCISVVGARRSTREGEARARKLVKGLVEHGLTIVSGLALGIDTAALRSAIDCGGRVVGVIGTPIDRYYPPENRGLQDLIADKFLLISQVPFFRYEHEPFNARRIHFPQRNETMSALSEATVIVEASDTSGTLSQARAALQQRRKLFILNSCFENPAVKWPERFAQQGAIRVHDLADILRNLDLPGKP